MILAAHPDSYSTLTDRPADHAGHGCDQLWMLRAALTRAPEMSATALPTGLQRTKAIDLSSRQGPSDFTGKVGTAVSSGGFAQFMGDWDSGG